MEDSLKKTNAENAGIVAGAVNSAANGANSANGANGAVNSAVNGTAAPTDADKRREERVKRMRGWLGVKSSVPSYGHGDDGGPVSYGDAPNGWNR